VSHQIYRIIHNDLIRAGGFAHNQPFLGSGL
jgi:hypothetical protein